MTTPSKPAGAVVYVKDVAPMRAFYEAVAGFSVERAAPDHTVLRSSALQLVLVQMPARIAATIEIASPPERRTENPIKLIVPVASIAAARSVAPRFNGELLPPEREWDFDTARLCDGYDPEGNVVQFREDAPPTA